MTTHTGIGSVFVTAIALLLAGTIAGWAPAVGGATPPVVGAVVDDGSPF